jgi:hypothetical protein
MAVEKSSHKFAFLIGCNEYENLPALRCPVTDAKDIGEALANPEIGGFDQIALFVDGEANWDILASLEEVITSKAKSTDTVVIYFSGHGKLDQLGKLYLALKKTKEAALDSTSIAVERILGYIGRSSCQTFLFILDCCYSGAIGGAFSKGGVEGALTEAVQGRGITIMTSSTDLQLSHEKEGETNSVFTKFLIEGLLSGHADLDNDGRISADEAFGYTEKLVVGTGLQTPTKFNLKASGDIVLARNCKYVPVAPPNVNDVSPEDFNKFLAVKNMIDLLQANPPPKFHVSLSSYSIEGFDYRTSALTVSPDHTLNIRQTNSGFECDTFFPPQMIQPATREGKEVINGIIKVRMRVDLKDINFILGRLDNGGGRQIELYRPSGDEYAVN